MKFNLIPGARRRKKAGAPVPGPTGEAEHPDRQTPAREPGPPAPSRKHRSWWRLLARGVFLLLFTALLLVVGLGVILEYYFPSEFVTPLVERELSRVLRQPVSIGRIDFTLLSGLRIQRVSLSVAGRPLASVDEVRVGYDLLKLFEGKLAIDQVVVQRPRAYMLSKDGVWNFQPLLMLGTPPAAPGTPVLKPQPQEPSALPLLPVEVDLKRLAIENIGLDLDQDGHTLAQLEGFSLEAQGRLKNQGLDAQVRIHVPPPTGAEVSPNLVFKSSRTDPLEFRARLHTDLKLTAHDLNRVLLTGIVGWQDAALQANRSLSLPALAADINIEVALRQQMATLKWLKLRLDESNFINLSARVEHFNSEPRFNLSLDSATFRLADVQRWAAPWLPPLEAGGVLRIAELDARGYLPQFQLQEAEVVRAKFYLDQVSGKDPASGAKFDGLSGNLSLAQVRLVQGNPENVESKLHLSLDKGMFRNIGLHNLRLDLQAHASGPRLAQANLKVDTRLEQLRFSHPDLGDLKAGFFLKGTVDGDPGAGNIRSVKLQYGVGDWLRAETEGSLQKRGQDFFRINQDLTVGLEPLRKAIPAKLLERFKGLEVGGKVTVKTSTDGKLDERFHPVKANGKAEVELHKVTARLAEPAVQADGIGFKVSFPVEYDAARGIKVAMLHIAGGLEQARVMNNWGLTGLKISTDLGMDRFFDYTRVGVTLPLTHKTLLQAGRIESQDLQVKLDGLDVDATARADLLGREVRNVSLNAAVSLNALEGMDMIRAGKFHTRIGVDVHDLSLSRVRAEASGSLKSPSFKKGDLALDLDSVSFDTVGHLDVPGKNAEIQFARVSIPSLLQAELKGKVNHGGKSFALESTVDRVNLAEIWKRIPEAFKSGLEGAAMEGQLRTTAQARGTIPTAVSLKNPDLPFTANAQLELSGIAMTLPDRGIRLEGLGGTVRTDLVENRLEVEGTLGTSGLVLENLLGDSRMDPAFAFHYSLQNNLDKLVILRHELGMKNHGVKHRLTGRVEGLHRFLSGESPWTPYELSRRLDVALDTDNTLEIGKALEEKALALKDRVRAEGNLVSHLALRLAGDKQLELDGSATFDHFRLSLPPSLRVGEINGKFLFNKKLWLNPSLLDHPAQEFYASEKGFFNQLRDYSQYKNILKIDAVEWEGQKASDITLDVFYKNNRLMVEKFLFDVLKGSVAGNLFLVHGPQGPRLNFTSEFAGLDFGALLDPDGKKKDLEAQVDGNVEFGFQVIQGRETDPISLDQLRTQIDITRVGPETLDRILLFLDPEESKPALVDTRAKLKLASPDRATILLENGNLNVEAWLKNKILGNLLKAPELKRVPVTNLKPFREINEKLQALQGLRDLLRYLSAQGMEVGEDGEITWF